MSTETLPQTAAPPKAPHPAATFVLSQLTTRFRLAAEHALAAETQEGHAATYLEAFRRWVNGDGPCPIAFRRALMAVHGAAVVEVQPSQPQRA